MTSPDTKAQTADTQVVLLGTGTPNAEPERWGPSVAIVVDDRPYLIDLGPGLVRRAAAAFQAGVRGLDVSGLDRAFVTHLHSDHTVGYPDLILSPWVLERHTALHVYGPPGLAHMTAHLLSAYEQDITERLAGLEPANDTGCQVFAHEVRPGRVYEDGLLAVDAFAVDHGAWPAYGYRFQTPHGVVVLSGDTAPSDGLIAAARGCDVLIHEVYSDEGLATRPAEWQRYHKAVHTSALELAQIASEVRPKLLVLYHQLRWGVSTETLVAEVQQGYAGAVVSGSDLDIYELPTKGRK